MPMLRRKDLVCQEAIELLTEYLEGTLSRRQRRRLGPTLTRAQLFCLPRTDPDDHPPHRKYRARRPFSQGGRRILTSSTAAGGQASSSTIWDGSRPGAIRVGAALTVS